MHLNLREVNVSMRLLIVINSKVYLENLFARIYTSIHTIIIKITKNMTLLA